MIENNSLTYLLAFNDILVAFKTIPSQGKEIASKLCDLLTEQLTLQSGEEEKEHSTIEKRLYSHALNAIEKEKAERMLEFENIFKTKLESTKQSINKILAFFNNLEVNEAWILETNTQYRLALYELIVLCQNISEGIIKHIDFVSAKWKHISRKTVEGVAMRGEMKIFILHISFETYINGNLITSWEQLLVELQSKKKK